MNLTAFGKLSKIKLLKAKLTRVSLDLSFKRITNNKGVSLMDLNIFFDAMEDLAGQIFPGQLGKCDALIDTVLENINDLKPTNTTTSSTSASGRRSSANNINNKRPAGYMGDTVNSRMA